VQDIAGGLERVKQLAFLFEGLLRRLEALVLEVGLRSNPAAQFLPQIVVRTSDILDDKPSTIVHMTDREGPRNTCFNHSIDLIDGQTERPLQTCF